MRKREVRISVVLAAVAVLAALTLAAGEQASVIKQRQGKMEEIGKAMKALGAMAKKQAPFDPAVVKSSAETIADSLKQAAELFPEGSGAGDVETWAKPEIWSDRTEFDHTLQSAHAAAVDLQSVTDEAALMPALGALGNGCKSCHEKYRRPKS